MNTYLNEIPMFVWGAVATAIVFLAFSLLLRTISAVSGQIVVAIRQGRAPAAGQAAGQNTAAENAAVIAKGMNEQGKGLIYFFLLTFIVLIGIELLVNIHLRPEWNLIPFFLVPVIYAANGFSPIGLLTFMGLGAFTQGLNDKDISKGAVTGAKILLRVVLTIVLIYWMLTGILATLAVKENPLFFLIFVACLMVSYLLFYLQEVKAGKYLRMAVVGYSIVICIWHFIPIGMSWIPTSVKGSLWSTTNGQAIMLIGGPLVLIVLMGLLHSLTEKKGK